MKKTIFVFFTIVSLSIINCSAQFTKLLDYGDTTNGAGPYGYLFLDGTFIYGSTVGGGTTNDGTVFKIKTDGTSYTKLLDFNNSGNGRNPVSSVFFDGTDLYGTTNYGGTYNFGTVFKVKTDGTSASTIHTFNDTLGKFPSSSFVSDGTFLYGTTNRGGPGLYGTLFKMLPDGTSYTILKTFDYYTNGIDPGGKLFYDGTYLYGTTVGEAIYNFGDIYRIKTDGTGYTELINFDNVTTGKSPVQYFTSDGTYLYGMTGAGGPVGYGNIFKIKYNGTGYVKLFDFDGVTGSSPSGALVFDGVFLYGVTGYGGTYGRGNIFKILPDGTRFEILKSFNDTINEGIIPAGDLISDGTFLYGATAVGGVNNSGTLYKFAIPPSCIANYTTTYDSTLNTFNLYIDSATAAIATSYVWDFGDGTTSSLPAPSHLYTTDSLYNLCMTIYTAAGDSCTYCDTIGIDSAGNIVRNAGFNLIVHNTNTTTDAASIDQGIKVKVFPNPSTGIFQLTIDQTHLKTINGLICVYNVLGEKVYSMDCKQLSNNTAMIDLSNQSNGIYFIQLRTENPSTPLKFIINK